MLQNIDDYIELFLENGLTPTPLRKNSKEPIVEAWTTKPKTKLLELVKKHDGNIGIRIEPPLFIVDVDDKRLAPLILGEVPSTWVVETKRGLHVYLKASKDYYPQTNKKSRMIQLLGEKCQVVAPPSIVEGHDYRFVSDSYKHRIAELDTKKVRMIEQIIETFAKHEPLILKLTEIWSEGHRHNLSLWLNGCLRKAGVSLNEAAVIVKSICLLTGDSELKDRLTTLETTYKQPINRIGAWSYLKRELESIVGPEQSSEILKLLPQTEEEHEKEDEARKKIARIIVSKKLNNTMLEVIAVEDGGELEPRLLVYDGQRFSIVESFESGGRIYKPKNPKMHPYPPYLINSEISRDVLSREQLLDLIFKEVDSFVDVEYEIKVLITATILLSYVQELFNVMPYLYFVGDTESGKSHSLNLISRLSYRPLHGTSLNAADIYSYLEHDDVPLTIIEDEFQGSERDNDKMKIYKSGYKRGAKVPRVTLFEGGRRIDYFNCYGLKIIAAEKLIDNKGFLERCIIIEMVEGIPQKDEYSTEDEKRFNHIRNELLKWRMKVLLGLEQLPSINLDLRGRLKELFKPLLTIVSGTKYYEILERYVMKKVEEKLEAKQNSLEGLLTRIVYELSSSEGYEIAFHDIWEKLVLETGGIVDDRHPKSIDTEAYGTISKMQVSKRLQEVLGSKIRRVKSGGETIVYHVFNPEKLERATTKYRVTKLPRLPISGELIGG